MFDDGGAERLQRVRIGSIKRLVSSDAELRANRFDVCSRVVIVRRRRPAVNDLANGINPWRWYEIRLRPSARIPCSGVSNFANRPSLPVWPTHGFDELASRFPGLLLRIPWHRCYHLSHNTDLAARATFLHMQSHHQDYQIFQGAFLFFHIARLLHHLKVIYRHH